MLFFYNDVNALKREVLMSMIRLENNLKHLIVYYRIKISSMKNNELITLHMYMFALEGT